MPQNSEISTGYRRFYPIIICIAVFATYSLDNAFQEVGMKMKEVVSASAALLLLTGSGCVTGNAIRHRNRKYQSSNKS